MSKIRNGEELKSANKQLKKIGQISYEEFCANWDVRLITTAKEYLEEQMLRFEKTMFPEMKAALKVALHCMSCLSPIKPEATDSGTMYICPKCKKIVHKHEQSHGNLIIPHCKWCGQSWDWSEE